MKIRFPFVWRKLFKRRRLPAPDRPHALFVHNQGSLRTNAFSWISQASATHACAIPSPSRLTATTKTLRNMGGRRHRSAANLPMHQRGTLRPTARRQVTLHKCIAFTHVCRCSADTDTDTDTEQRTQKRIAPHIRNNPAKPGRKAQPSPDPT